MCTEILLANQPAWPENLRYIEDFRVLTLGPSGLSGEFWDDESTIVAVEDRDQFNRAGRDRRFSLEGQQQTFRNASAVAIILYVPRTRSLTRRLGQSTMDRVHHAALAQLLGRFTVLIKTTSDRARYWQGQALGFAPKGTPVVYLDGGGAVKVSRMEVAA